VRLFAVLRARLFGALRLLFVLLLEEAFFLRFTILFPPLGVSATEFHFDQAFPIPGVLDFGGRSHFP
jgi:hypothetical protein